MTKRMTTKRRVELIRNLRRILAGKKGSTAWTEGLPEVRPTTAGLTQAQPVRKRK